MNANPYSAHCCRDFYFFVADCWMIVLIGRVEGWLGSIIVFVDYDHRLVYVASFEFGVFVGFFF